MLEYREDLEYFYEDGYGYQINYEQACVPLKNIFDNFRLGNVRCSIILTFLMFSISDNRLKKVVFPDQKDFFISLILELYSKVISLQLLLLFHFKKL